MRAEHSSPCVCALPQATQKRMVMGCLGNGMVLLHRTTPKGVTPWPPPPPPPPPLRLPPPLPRLPRLPPPPTPRLRGSLQPVPAFGHGYRRTPGATPPTWPLCPCPTQPALTPCRTRAWATLASGRPLHGHWLTAALQ
jgi:hypothetical protein